MYENVIPNEDNFNQIHATFKKQQIADSLVDKPEVYHTLGDYILFILLQQDKYSINLFS